MHYSAVPSHQISITRTLRLLMPTRHLATLLSGWERELLVLIETKPTNEEFWSYWVEREEAVEKLALSSEKHLVDAAFNRLFQIAESHGYGHLPGETARELAARFKLAKLDLPSSHK